MYAAVSPSPSYEGFASMEHSSGMYRIIDEGYELATILLKCKKAYMKIIVFKKIKLWLWYLMAP